MLRHVALVACLMLSLACGGDDTASTSSSSSSAGAGGSGGQGAGGGGATGGGGEGGAGGALDCSLDPLARMGSVEQIDSGYQFLEGPVWLASEGVLRFSDIPQSIIFELDGDTISPWRTDTGNANGLAIDPQNRLLACEGGARRVTRATNPNDAMALADNYQGNALNAPNDVIVRSDGNIYFTDPDYGLDPMDKELPYNGVFRIDPMGQLSLVDDGIQRPNGIALSPDETMLYVTDADNGRLWRYPIQQDGAIDSNAGGIFIATADVPDGMAVDDCGNLFITTFDGIQVFSAMGDPIGVISVPEIPANCTFGGPERRTLFITAREGLYRVELQLPGLP